MQHSCRCARLLIATLFALTACNRQAPLEVRVITDRTESNVAPLFALYEKATHVHVSPVYLDKGIIERLQSRPTEADVVLTKDAELLELAKRKQLLAAYPSTRLREIVPAQFRDADDQYFSESFRARVIYYAKDRVKPEELSTYEALADKKWKGRICIRSGYHDYNLSLFGQMLATIGPERTRAFVAGLAKNLARTPQGDDRGQARAIFEKKCDVAIVNSYYMGIMLGQPEQRAWALATEVFFPDQEALGTYILRSGVALTQATANVRAATALLEFMLADESQDFVANHAFAYPVTSRPLPELTRRLGAGQVGIKDGVFKIHVVPLADAVKQRDAVIRMLDEIQFDRPR
jgi:iron(III) transport system substrate-binding protein